MDTYGTYIHKKVTLNVALYSTKWCVFFRNDVQLNINFGLAVKCIKRPNYNITILVIIISRGF